MRIRAYNKVGHGGFIAMAASVTFSVGSLNSSLSSGNLFAPCSSRQHFPFPDVAMSVWPSVMHSCRVSSKSHRDVAARCQSQGFQRDFEQDGDEQDPLLKIRSVSSRKIEELMQTCKDSGSSDEHTAWKSWQAYFPKVEEEGNLISALKFQLEEAVKSEDFQEAAKLKKAIEAAKENDVILQVNKELEIALEEERYNDAARLRDDAGAGLVGWWSGISKSGNDPFGRIIRVKAAHGRLIAQNYSARQLAIFAQRTAQGASQRPVLAASNPLFEVFVKKEENGFNKQVVYLKRETDPATQADLDKLMDMDIEEIVDQAENAKRDEETTEKNEQSEEKTCEEDVKEANEIMDALKQRMPDLSNMKVIKVIAPEGTEADIPKIIEEIIKKEQREQQQQDNKSDSEESPTKAEDKGVTIRLVIGGPSPENGDGSTQPAVRVPATIKHESKDSFVLHVDSIPDDDQTDEGASKVTEVVVKASTDQMPDDDVAKNLWNAGKLTVQGSKELKDVIKLAVNQAQKMQSLPKTTEFHRIDVGDSMDPLTGLYVGAFGSNTPEILQLRRKYGHWDTQRSTSGEKLQFYEYVEAVKLTGDLNVPAGQISFRARIGKENKLSPVGVYPEEIGVIARYKGQGLLADPGFKNPKWTDGELVLLDGRKTGPTNGATLGFVFYLPDHHFLILFDRLNLERT